MPIDDNDLQFIANEVSKDFCFFKNKRVFLTGGTGFFGKWILESFIYLNKVKKLNIKVLILSRSPEKFCEDYPQFSNHDFFSFIKGDIRDFSNVSENYDLIIHAATDASAELRKSDPELMRNTIIDGAKMICELAIKVNCKRILYTSSGAAYGPQPNSLKKIPETFVDNSVFNHKDVYAESKLLSEEYFKQNSPCELVIARCFTFAGPYLPLDDGYAFGNFIRDYIDDREILIKSDGLSVRSYLYGADLVVWLFRMLSSGVDGEIYNVGSSSAISIKELAEKISPLNVNVVGGRDGYNNVYLPSVDKAFLELGLQEKFTIDQIISKTKLFYKKG